MDRRNLAALAFAAVLAGGAWWWYARQRQLEQGELAPGGFDFPELRDLAAQLGDALGGIVTRAQDAVETVADTVQSTVSPGAWSPPSRAEPYMDAIRAAEAQYGIPPMMLARLLYQESRFRQDIITGQTRSGVGATGIAQFMPATARELGVDPLDPIASIDAAGRYLSRLAAQLGGDWKQALAAYNWGIGNVKRRGLDAAPTETRNYVAQITGDIGYA